MRIKQVKVPISIDDAYEDLISQRGAVLLAGGMFTRLSKREIPLAIDLSVLNMTSIHVGQGQIELEAMVNLRQVETHPHLPQALKESILQIGGLALRNMATIGGSVMGRYPFSDVATGLLGLDTHLILHRQGQLSLKDFLGQGLEEEDILLALKCRVPIWSGFKAYKPVYTDFSLVNMALAIFEDKAVLAIGARSGRARSIQVSLKDLGSHLIDNFDFASDYRASGDYRRALAKSLLEDLIKEVPSGS